MGKGVDLEAILNVKKVYDKKVNVLKKSLESRKFLLRKLEAISIHSSEQEVEKIFSLIANNCENGRMITFSISAEALLKRLKILCAELVKNFSAHLDEIVDQLMIFHLQKRTDDHKILRQMLSLIFNTAQFNAIHYRILYHPQFLRAN